MAEKKGKAIMAYYRQKGVRDLKPMKARAQFAKALMIENVAGKTTPEAEEALELAIQALD